MSGIFGVVSKENCILDAYSGTFYLQNRAEAYCGLAWFDGEELKDSTHKGLLKENFSRECLKRIKGNSAIGCVSGTREPVSETSGKGEMMLCYDGNLINYEQIKENLLKQGNTFSGFCNSKNISDSVLISKIISKESSFEKGIESLVDKMEGDFAIIALTKPGIYAARGRGRKPLILGKKEGSYAVSSESVSFENRGFEIVRDVEPGEIIFLNSQGINSVKKLSLGGARYCTFEWIYTAHPASIVDGRSVELARNIIGRGLAKKYPISADIVSPIPNSGRCHANGYAAESGIPYFEVFKKFDYCGRSYTPSDEEERMEVAQEKLIPVRSLIIGNRIIIVDDSIVRGNQTHKQTKRLKQLGAKEVHAMIACPPLTSACNYGKSTKKNEDCIARRMSLDKIRETRGLDSLNYASIEILEEAIGKPKEKLCLDCWRECNSCSNQ